MASAAASKGLVGLVKRGWQEIPEIMGSSVLALIGLGLGCYGTYRNYKTHNYMKTYKYIYTVYREDDPKVAELRKYNKID